jgi:hypothetical protein
MTAAITYSEACADPHLFGPWLKGESWATWRVIDKALFGLPLDEAERAVFRDLTGRDQPPTEPSDEAWIIAGRRAGKDVKAASLGVYLATIGVTKPGQPPARAVRSREGSELASEFQDKRRSDAWEAISPTNGRSRSRWMRAVGN